MFNKLKFEINSTYKVGQIIPTCIHYDNLTVLTIYIINCSAFDCFYTIFLLSIEFLYAQQHLKDEYRSSSGWRSYNSRSGSGWRSCKPAIELPLIIYQPSMGSLVFRCIKRIYTHSPAFMFSHGGPTSRLCLQDHTIKP